MPVIQTFDYINTNIEKLIHDLLWNGRDTVKRKTIIGNTKKGGLNMPDCILQSVALKTLYRCKGCLIRRIIILFGIYSQSYI